MTQAAGLPLLRDGSRLAGLEPVLGQLGQQRPVRLEVLGLEVGDEAINLYRNAFPLLPSHRSKRYEAALLN